MGYCLTGRLENLDAARGIAALIVVVFHALVYSGELLGENPGWGDFIASSPIAWMVSGGGGVIVFFVLSGFVLDRSSSMGLRPSAKRWVAGRLARLYLPIIPVLFGAFLLGSLNHPNSMDALYLGRLFLDVTLIFGHGEILGVLWSLRWEIIYSMLFPLVLHLFRRTMRIRVVHLAAIVLISGFGNFLNVGFVQYLPMIFAGFLLSRYLENAVPGDGDLGLGKIGGSTLSKFTALMISLLMIGAEIQVLALSRVFQFENADTVQTILQMVSLTGSILLVGILFKLPTLMGWPGKVSGFLGAISFSLYLVHGPVLELFVRLFPVQSGLSICAGVTASILIGKLYFEHVESRMLRFSKRLRGD